MDMTNKTNKTDLTNENNILAIVSLVLLSFVLGTCEFIIVGILTDISESLNVPITKAGGLISAFALAYSLFTPFSAAIAGKFKRFNFIIFGSIVFIILTILCAFVPNYNILLIIRISLAIVIGSLVSVSMSFAPYISDEKTKAAAVTAIFAGFSVAAILGVPIGTSISYIFNWRVSFIAIASISAVVLILNSIFLPKNTPNIQSCFIGQFVIFKDKRFLLSIITTFFAAALSYVLYTYLEPILTRFVYIPNKYMSLALLILGITALTSNFLSGVLVNRNGIYKLRFIFLIQTAVMFLLPLAFKNNISSGIFIVLVVLLMYLSVSPIQVNVLNFASKDYPSSLTLAASNNPFSFNLGIAFGSLVGSFIYDSFGMEFVGIGGGVLAIFSFISVILLYKVNKSYNK